VIRGLVIAASVGVLVIAAVLTGRNGETDASYERSDVERAFAKQGFTLIDTHLFGSESSVEALEALLSPVSGEPFLVYIARSDELAKEQFASYAELRTPDTFDLLRGNVMAISDSGLGRTDRQRVRAAIRALKDADQSAA
jgi:hypothetical protein